ncbi:EAL domain-containing protein [Bacilliculturomica massiliensis]|uniref:EAL domain-containing protein n=1 Tax=Bacilliculturomica massiliensis TaxID=1917867 RepID=UPI00103183CD|nr:EAL domain-containing protein [Bacilliculturomica massiliensis]
MASKKTILVVEDNEINRAMLCEILYSEYLVLEAGNGQEALDVLQKHKEEISLILLDIIMPVMDGYTFLSRIKEDPSYASIPVIVTTQSDAEADEVAALSHGATDFVAKPYKPQVILHRVAGIIRLRETAAMINQFQFDRLTGLFSKEFFYQQVKEVLGQHPEKEYDIVCSDIENFKLINDVFGVPAGDSLLRGVANMYKGLVGEEGVCGRLHADQFACLMERRDYQDQFFIQADSQIDQFAGAKNIVVKWGVYPIEDRTLSAEQMCDRALLAARKIKGQYGKHFSTYDDDLRSQMLHEQAITDVMEQALTEEQFVIYLQPKYNLRTDRLAGAEALVRWVHPKWGLQPPAVFIPLFEKNGFITKLDQYVWEKTCAVLHDWDRKGYPPVPVSVNVSRADIYQVDLAEVLLDIIRRYDISPDRLHLEITESAYTEDPDQIIQTVRRLREMGFIVEMDDFGSGYSSLNMLNQLPLDILKLDMKFIQSETAKPSDQGILGFIMGLARWMNLSVVAEGVETREQLERLRAIGCDYVQGYYFAKPMPCEEFASLLKEQGSVSVEESSVNKRLTAAETMLAFTRMWFEEQNLEEAAAFLEDDVSFIGTGAGESARGKAAMTEYIRQDIAEIEEPFDCDIAVTFQQQPSERVCALAAAITLRNTQYTWHLRGFYVLVEESGQWKICSIHISEPSRNQTGDEHYPKTLLMEHIARERQELLNDSVPGGMMGGYIQEGFPFYFINRQMLDYLGYESEDEFVADIGGMISNCMHPDDRENVDRTVEEQLRRNREYAVDYRMKKKDGSYIWVHDLGRQMTAEDGRAAISSVCIDITAQKAAQEEVLRLYNNIPGGVFRCRFDRDLSVIDANDSLFDFIGYSREEFAAMGNKMSAVLHPDDMAAMEDVLNRQLLQGNTIQNQNRLLCKDGSVRWVGIKAQLIEEQNGERHFYCVLLDITEEKRLQERINELYEQEMAYFAEVSSKDGTFQGRINVTKNQMENYLSTAEAAVARVGDTYDETVDNLASSAVDPAYGEVIRSRLDRSKVLADYAAGKVDYHFKFLRRRNSGSAFWSGTNFRTCVNPETGDVIMFFYTLDITEQVLQEQLLGKITRVDYDIITEINLATGEYQIAGHSDDWEPTVPFQGDFSSEILKVVEKCIGEAAKEEFLAKLVPEYMKAQLAKQDSYTFIAEFADENRGPRVKRFQVFYISEELERVCMTQADVTDVVRQEQKQKEELAAALVAAEQANAAKSDFLSRMSHEIRTPMNAIIGMSTIAAQSVGDDEQVADCISKIGISSRFLLSLINDILDMSRIESGKMLLKNEKIPVEEFLNGITSICYAQGAAKGVEYECIVDPVLDDYYIGDAMKLQQVLINILSNAIKFTSEGGKVTFSVQQRRRTKNDALLRFIVNDTGVGMSEDFLPHIFEPFSQESTGTTALYGGTGLGLAISKNIVDMMDGKITVRSIKGIGTEFTVDVKLGITEEEKLRHHQKKQVYNFSHLKTLVVDDDVAVCESAIVTLREMGITAEWTDSGRKAVDRVKELWSADRYFDMILIDWKMPEMDGLETARRIRAIVGPEVTIIIMTAYDWISIEHEAKLAGVNLLMSKPMFKSSLVSAFTKALGEKEEQAQRPCAEDYDFSGKRILLAEDNALNTEVAVMLLECKGFQVDTAENGLRALELYSKTEEGYYDAILLDIRMPLMDGLTAAANIRHLSNIDAGSIPIIAMTANAFDDDIEKSKAAGMDAHLAKPIDPDRLYQTLYDFIFGKES